MLLKFKKIYYTNCRIELGENMKKEHVMLIVLILLAFSVTVGTTYAVWSNSAVQSQSNEIVAGCLEIEINDLDVNGLSTSINLANSYPMSDLRGVNTDPYTITVKNVCNINAQYTILLNTISNSLLTEDNLKYHFVKTSPTETTMTPALVSSMTESLKNIANSNIYNSYELISGNLNAQTENVTDSVTYNLRLWIDENAGNEVMGNEFEASIAVYAEVAN